MNCISPKNFTNVHRNIALSYFDYLNTLYTLHHYWMYIIFNYSNIIVQKPLMMLYGQAQETLECLIF